MASAVAQQFLRLVVFGDSFSDNGNFYLRSGRTAPAPPYSAGHATNGAVWVEQIGASNLQGADAFTGNVDKAIGGAQTDGTPTSLRSQFAAYVAAGGQFGPGDLTVIFGGANNIFQPIDTPHTADAAGDAIAAANKAAGDVAALARDAAAAGAGTVLVVDLHDLGATPNFRGGPMQAAATAATTAFDTALTAQIAAVNAAAPDSSVILMDIRPLFAAIQASPAAYGFADVTGSAFDGRTTLAANPDSYLWFDNVHWTAAGHRLVAALARSILYHDDVLGPGGGDLLYGFVQNDSLSGLEGADTLIALGGDDTVSGGAGNDDVNGNVGRDIVHGDDGADIVRGGKGADAVFGDAGDDLQVNGNLGNDTVHGDDGNDSVYGGQGDDRVFGDAGGDRVSGDLGNDLLYGGAGADRFVFAAGFGIDWIGDFNAAEGDRIQLTPGLAYSVVVQDGQTVLALAGGDRLGLAGVSGFSADWVVFG